MPATTLKVSVRPEPIRPNTPVIWPSKTEKELLRTIIAHRDVLHRQHLLAGRPAAARDRACGRARPTACGRPWRAMMLVAVEACRVAAGDQLAVAQDGDAVGEQQRLFQRMADEDDRHAARLEAPHQREEMALLLRRQRRRRLVEDDHFGIVVDGARDLHHLPLGRAERLDDGGRIDREVQRLQELLRRRCRCRAAG